MRAKRFLSGALAAVLALGLWGAAPAPARAVEASGFSDLAQLPQVAQAAEMLRVLGVVNGMPGGAYHPEGTLSRAEFCAMAVRALDREADEPAQRGRTIYLDVPPGFWATGYINLASAITLGDTPLVSGVGDGTFQPYRVITFGEAVAILCRMLGYGAGDVAAGGAWYDGYLAVGAAAGLTDGLILSGADVIDRGQAAILFYNLYFAQIKGSEDTYLTRVGGSESLGHVLLDVDATADDGTTGAVRTTRGVYKTGRTLDVSMVGQEGSVLLNSKEELLAFLPKEGASQRLVNLTGANATYLTSSGGEKVTVEPETVVYKDGKATTWALCYMDLAALAPVPVTFHYGANGKLSYIFLSGESEDTVTSMVARTTPNGVLNPFAAMAQGGSYTMFKNGSPADVTDLRQYDVATWDPATRVIQVCDVKLTGLYEDASPSPDAPVTIKVLGVDFPVLSSARNDLSRFRVGDKITLLLTSDNKVAGVVSADVVKGDAVGVASVSGETATIRLLQGGLEITGAVSAGASRFDNQLVVVSGSTRERLSLTAISTSAAPGDLDVAARTLGSRTVADNVDVYDRVKNGATVAVRYDTLPSAVARSKISYVSYDYAGRVRTIVLDNVTGDGYTYGYLSRENADQSAGYTDILCVRMAGEGGADAWSHRAPFSGGARQGAPGGIAYTVNNRVAEVVYLTAIKGVSATAFDMEEMTVTVAGVAYPISDNVQCYNTTTKTWFARGRAGLEAARAYAQTVTVYYDRDPAKGGKIRLVEVA